MKKINGVLVYEAVEEYCDTKFRLSLREDIIQDCFFYFKEVCKEFGINRPSKPLNVYFYELDEDSPMKAAGLAQKVSDMYHVGFCWKLFFLEPELMTFQTIPHEIAHIIVYELFPEVLDPGHGKEWQEVMKYMGFSTEIKMDVSSETLLELGITIKEPEILEAL